MWSSSTFTAGEGKPRRGSMKTCPRCKRESLRGAGWSCYRPDSTNNLKNAGALLSQRSNHNLRQVWGFHKKKWKIWFPKLNFLKMKTSTSKIVCTLDNLQWTCQHFSSQVFLVVSSVSEDAFIQVCPVPVIIPSLCLLCSTELVMLVYVCCGFWLPVITFTVFLECVFSMSIWERRRWTQQGAPFLVSPINFSQ